MSRISALVSRLSAPLSNGTFNLSLPWDGLSTFLLGSGVNLNRRRRRGHGRGSRRSRNCPRSTLPGSTTVIIPPPHIRRQDADFLPSTRQPNAESCGSFLFNRSNQNTFAYSVLGKFNMSLFVQMQYLKQWLFY